MFELLLKHSSWAYRTGEFAFASGWPIWLLLALILAGAALIAWSLARRRYLSLGRALAIGALQTALLALVLTLLWRPVLIVERVRDRENVVAVVMDASASMAHGEGDRSRLQEAVSALESGPLDALRRTFGVNLFAFAATTVSLQSLDEVPPPGPQTRIGDALRRVLEASSSVPLSGVVLVSDGAENGRTLTEEQLAEIVSFGVPVHTVGVGPERTENDLELDSIALATQASPGEMLPAEVSIRHDTKGKTRLRVYDGEKLLASTEVELSADAGVTTATVEIPAGEPGVRDLRFSLDPLEGERNVINNSRRHVVDVASRRRNVLYVEGEPRWEYKFIRRAAESDGTLRLASVVRTTPNRFYRQGIASPDELAEGFPKDAAALFAYDAVIIGSYEAAALSGAQHQMLLDFVDRRGGGLLMLAGRDGLSDGGWSRAPIAEALPALLANPATKSYVRTPVTARLTTYGAESPINRFHDDPRRNAALWSEMPPLGDFQPVGRLKPGAIVLLEAVQGERASPLLVWQRYGRGRTFILSTASTWRWKMRLPSTDQRHHTFWRQLMHALAAESPERVSLTTERKVYDDDPRVVLHAELRDERFEPITDASVELTVDSDTGATYTVPMRPSGQGDGRYMGVVDAARPGLYRATLRGKAGEREIEAVETHFRRNDGVLEHFGTRQNRALLERIAAATGGRYWTLDALDGLPEAMRYSKAGIVERQTLDLWNLPVVFLLLLALKGAEWLLRLRWRRL